MKPWRLTQQAERSLTEIAQWTINTFGTQQADRYQSDLLTTCTNIASGTAQRQSCSILLGHDLQQPIFFSRCGGHYVVFAETEEVIVVLDILHQRSDLSRKIAALNAT